MEKYEEILRQKACYSGEIADSIKSEGLPPWNFLKGLFRC